MLQLKEKIGFLDLSVFQKCQRTVCVRWKELAIKRDWFREAVQGALLPAVDLWSYAPRAVCNVRLYREALDCPGVRGYAWPVSRLHE
jgi:hypothetical protein